MENSVYCAPTHMRFLVGTADARRVRVHGFDERPLPPDGMINGIITDERQMADFFADALRGYGAGRNDTTLTINTNSIQTKLMDVPRVAESKVLDFIRREFTQFDAMSGGMEERGENVYDYTVVNASAPGGGVTLLAACVPAEVLRSYRETFLEAGFRLRRINIGVNCEIKLLRALARFRGKTFLLVQVDGRFQSLTLFVGGRFCISNRFRLVGAEGTLERLSEIGGNVSSMLQFAMSQRTDGSPPLSETCFAGLSDAELSRIAHDFAYLNVEMNPLGMPESVALMGKARAREGFDAGRYMYNLGAMLRI